MAQAIPETFGPRRGAFQRHSILEWRRAIRATDTQVPLPIVRWLRLHRAPHTPAEPEALHWRDGQVVRQQLRLPRAAIHAVSQFQASDCLTPGEKRDSPR